MFISLANHATSSSKSSVNRRLRLSPRHRLGQHPVRRTLHPTYRRCDHDSPPPQRHMSPSALVLVVARSRRETAPRAPVPPPSPGHSHRDLARPEMHASDPCSLQRQQLVEYRTDAHRTSALFVSSQTRSTTARRCAFSTPLSALCLRHSRRQYRTHSEGRRTKILTILQSYYVLTLLTDIPHHLTASQPLPLSPSPRPLSPVVGRERSGGRSTLSRAGAGRLSPVIRLTRHSTRTCDRNWSAILESGMSTGLDPL